MPTAPPALPKAATRAAVRRLRVAAVAGAATYAGVLLASMGLRPDFATVAFGSFGARVITPLVVCALAVLMASRVGRGWVGRPGVAAAAALAVASWMSGLIMVLAPWLHGLGGGDACRAVARCASGTVLLAAGPFVLAVLAFRHAFASSSGWRTASLGVASGALAAAAMGLHCSADGLAHLLLGHGAAMVAGGLVGLALGRLTRA